MLTIRLSRVGRKNKPNYRLIVSEKTKDPYGRALEILGSYDPYSKKLEVKQDRIKHWIDNGSGMSKTVSNLLIENKIIEGEKVKATNISKKRKAKLEEKNKKEEKPAEVEEKKTEEKPKETLKEENIEKPAESSENEKTEIK